VSETLTARLQEYAGSDYVLNAFPHFFIANESTCSTSTQTRAVNTKGVCWLRHRTVQGQSRLIFRLVS
jgi:hypothetical protein